MKKRESKSKRLTAAEPASAANSLDRRTFVRLVPALGAAALATPHLNIASALAQGPTPAPTPLPSPSPSPTPLRVSKEMLHQAEKLIGIELTDAQEAMALQNVSTNLDRYETLRKIDVPLDTEPATLFHPALPGKKFTVKPSKFKLSKVDLPKFSSPGSLEELAFASVSQLAELIRTRKVSPVDLTRMYLGRLKKYGPKLNCVVTLTEDLALAQAAEADREIKAGKYRGPLHGIPWGAKDLFATKGTRTTWGAEPYRDQVIDYDATVVERLREAGAVLVAKLFDGRTRAGRSLVCRHDQESLAGGGGQDWFERFIGWSSFRHSGGTRRFFNRHGDTWLDHFALIALRGRWTATDLRTYQSLRRNGTELDHG